MYGTVLVRYSNQVGRGDAGTIRTSRQAGVRAGGGRGVVSGGEVLTVQYRTVARYDTGTLILTRFATAAAVENRTIVRPTLSLT